MYTINNVVVATEKEYKVKTLRGDGTFDFVTGGDMSVDGDGEKVLLYILLSFSEC